MSTSTEALADATGSRNGLVADIALLGTGTDADEDISVFETIVTELVSRRTRLLMKAISDSAFSDELSKTTGVSCKD